ncbi:MAG: hypothetical protein ACNA70_03275 [Brevefilum sp.]
MFRKLGLLTILIILALMASVPAVFAQGQALIIGSFWIKPGEDEIHINLNARAGDYWGDNTYAASGHIHYREADGITRMAAIMMLFDPPPPEYGFWWPEDCAYVRGIGISGPREGDILCLQVCGNRVYNAWWNFSAEPEFSNVSFTRGSVVIKP